MSAGEPGLANGAHSSTFAQTRPPKLWATRIMGRFVCMILARTSAEATARLESTREQYSQCLFCTARFQVAGTDHRSKCLSWLRTVEPRNERCSHHIQTYRCERQVCRQEGDLSARRQSCFPNCTSKLFSGLHASRARKQYHRAFSMSQVVQASDNTYSTLAFGGL